MRLRSSLVLLMPLGGVALMAACGSRTDLFVSEELGVEGGRDTAPDVVQEPDVLADARSEADAAPPIDASSPPPDAPLPCPDAGATLIYVVTEQKSLMSFYPPSGAFTFIGSLACPAAGAAFPYSMGVDQSGTAYVVYSDGELFRVSTATASCEATGFARDQGGVPTVFGMGFTEAAERVSPTLYVAGNPGTGTVLGTINTTTLEASMIGAFQPSIKGAELAGTDTGYLFALYDGSLGPTIGEINKATAEVVMQFPLAGVTFGSGWAFAYWESAFYVFTAPAGSSIVSRFGTTGGPSVQVGSTDQTIVGAGVSTCAPQP